MSTSTRLPILAALLSAAACVAAAQPATAEAAPEPETPPGVGIKVSFRPSVAIVVGIFTMIFSLTFLLLMYAKFCHPSSPVPAPTLAADAVVPAGSDDGVAKPVIESLPFFRFAALRGARQGLECAVCLARFDDADLLRLLPRCRHAFHLDCVDRWLESKASCPLCRARVDADDAALGLKYASSARFVPGGGGASDRFDGDGDRDLLGIFVERVPSSRMEPAAARCLQDLDLDRYKHRIVVSDAVFKSRWSELNSSDLIALDTELLRSMSSGRFPLRSMDDDLELELYGEAAGVKDKEEADQRKRLLASGKGSSSSAEAAVDAARMISSGVRSMSEMVSLPRLRAAMRERLADEEQARRRWVPIARRTAHWFAGRERRHVNREEDDDDEAAAVDSPPASHSHV
uniref:RING-type E3 ubiquitin transferase n=1 Tax=Oryza punctata TaxID=4537 RepID=A0A0E0L6M9_ORYPU